VLKLQNTIRAAIVSILIAVFYIEIATVLFLYAHVWVQTIYPILLIILTYFSATLYNQIYVTVERARLLRLATKDSLTGLNNIGHFQLMLQAELTTMSIRRDRSLTLLMMDVDNFKKVNDTYGHVAGDAVLRELAAILKSHTRSLDIVARYGGEEFIVLLTGANINQGAAVAEKIRMGLANNFFPHEKGAFSVTVSIGITPIHPDESYPQAIIERADKALYQAKETGKNKFVIISPKEMS
jgi:diguanylate cyclase (GGDEF)-like protein